MPVSTISRAESGKGARRLDTFLGVIGSVGFGFLLVDSRDRLLELDPEQQRIRDAGGRRFPPHLDWGDEPDGVFDRPWWGWHHIAYWPSREHVPAHIYWHRPRRHRLDGSGRPGERGLVWDGAT